MEVSTVVFCGNTFTTVIYSERLEITLGYKATKRLSRQHSVGAGKFLLG
jgi:hypothetical protein